MCVCVRVVTCGDRFFVEREPRNEEAPKRRLMEMILIEEVCAFTGNLADQPITVLASAE